MDVSCTQTGKLSFENCFAKTGGAVYGGSNTSITSENTDDLIPFTNCRARYLNDENDKYGADGYYGGAVYHNGGDLVLTNATFGVKGDDSKACTAYQGGARGLDAEIIERLNNFATSAKKPDLTFLMDLPPERGFERIRTREMKDGPYDRFEMEKLDFHRRVRQSFLDIAKKEPERVRVIDADRPREEIASEIEQIVDEFIH
jgi:hypothetical protein